jgi:hypothetical protein
MDLRRTSLARRLAVATAGSLVLATAGIGGTLAGGPPGPAFYVDGALYRTVGTPTDLSGTGAPASTYDVIYALGGDLRNVAEAKPGDTDYNGGRWMVLPLTWAAGVTPVQYTSDSEILAAEAAGQLTIADSPAKQFVCPVIRAIGGPAS